jgi:hypothetical protein
MYELAKIYDDSKHYLHNVAACEEFYKKHAAERDEKYGKGITRGEGIIKTQRIKEIREKIKTLVDEREERKRKMYSKPVFEKSPQEMFIKAIEQIDCECEPDSICDTCKLIKKGLAVYIRPFQGCG